MDVVEVVASASCDGCEVFDGVSHAVVAGQVGVDGVSIEAADFVAGFPFGLDECRCGVAFEFRFRASTLGGAHFLWVVDNPPVDVLFEAFWIAFYPSPHALGFFALVCFPVCFGCGVGAVSVVFSPFAGCFCCFGAAFSVVDFVGAFAGGFVCRFSFGALGGGPFDGVASADSEGGYNVVASAADVALVGGFVDVLVVDAGEGFGLAEGDHVGVVGVGGFGGHVVSFLCKNKLASFLFLFLL